MRAVYEVSPRECVDLALRARSRGMKRFHWIVVASTGLLVFALTVARGDGSRADLLVAVLAALVGAGGAHATTSFLNRWQVRSAVGPIFERHGRFLVEVELREEGVFFGQAGADVLIHWNEIGSAKLAKDGVEVWSPERLLGLVRDRGFASRAEMMAFLDEVNRRARAMPG